MKAEDIENYLSQFGQELLKRLDILFGMQRQQPVNNDGAEE